MAAGAGKGHPLHRAGPLGGIIGKTTPGEPRSPWRPQRGLYQLRGTGTVTRSGDTGAQFGYLAGKDLETAVQFLNLGVAAGDQHRGRTHQHVQQLFNLAFHPGQLRPPRRQLRSGGFLLFVVCQRFVILQLL